MNPSAFCQSWQLSLPLIQAPMAGGITTPTLVAEVCNAGAMGALAAALLSPARIREAIAAIRARTGRPFLVNLFVQEPPAPAADTIEPARMRLAPFYRHFGLEPPRPTQWCECFADQLDAVIEARPAWVSFTFGLVSAAVIERCHRAGIRVAGTATTVAEGLAWQAAGADAVCAQGIEAGGHRGGFDAEGGEIGTLALVPAMVDALSVPVFAAGGVMDGRGMAACLMLGAVAVQMGTAFLCCPESGAHPAWKQAILAAGDDPTRLTRAFSGRPARGLVNRFLREMAGQAVPAYPVQNALTAPLRQAAAAAGDADFLSLWAGQGVGLARALPAAALVATLAREWRAAGGQGD